MMMSMPSRASASAVARPMPRLAPVMSAMRDELAMATMLRAAGRRYQRPVEPGTSCSWLGPQRSVSVRAMDRDGLADFLRHRRQALQPEDVGLGPGRRRRTPGLRREEVAALAHMSTDFYTRLEQRRGSRPSAHTIGAIARALRLTLDERDHLLQLAGHTAPPRTRRTDHVSPALLRVLDGLDTPAQVVSDLGVTLEQNPLAEALLGVQTTRTGLARSMIYRWFTDPEERSRFPVEDHEVQSRRYTALLRGVQGRDPADPERTSSSKRSCTTALSSPRCGTSTESDCPPRCANASLTPPSA